MKIVFMGTPDFAVPCLRALIEAKYDVCGVFTQPDKPKGRGYKLTPPPVKVLAERNGIPVYQPQSLKKGEDAETALSALKELSPDLIVAVAYGKILPKEILELPKNGCINVHASLLPQYRGAGPIQWSVLNGEKVTGVTTMLMAEGLDTGDMLLQKSTEIGENETASELHDRLSELGAETLLETLTALEKGVLSPVKQDDALSTYAPMLTKEMCRIDFSKSAKEIHHQICGLSSWPCATAQWNGKRLKIYRSELAGKCGESQAGTIVNPKNFTVACGDGNGIRILELQTEGGKRMKTEDFLRGNPISDGAVLC